MLDLDFQRKTNFLVRFFSCFNKFFMLKFYLKNLNLSESLLKNEYVNILFILIIAIFLSIAIVFLSYLLVMQQPESEKLSSYECGFEPYEDARHKFDVQFYLIAILFVIFDIETMLVLPWVLTISKLAGLGYWCVIDFFFELITCYIYVIFSQSLNFKF